MKRTYHESTVDQWPLELTELVIHYGLCGQQKEDARWLSVWSLLSQRFNTHVSKIMKRGQCSRLACQTPIRLYSAFYMLGGGKVMTCLACAEQQQYTVLISGKPVTMKRGWNEPDKTSQWLKLKRIMV